VKPSSAKGFSSFAAWMLAAFLAAGGAQLQAEEVTTDHDVLTVLGNLEVAPGKSLDKDAVVLIVHGTLGHHRMAIISALQELLRERGVNSLAITLSLGVERRVGMFDCAMEQDHRHEDGADEIRTWVKWLKARGATNIVVAGHGRGANQAALYASQSQMDGAVHKLVLVAPLVETADAVDRQYFLRYKKILHDEYARAEAMAARGDAQSFMGDVGFLDCPHARVTAGAFLNYYAANPKFFTPNLLPSVKIPTLVIGGTADMQEPELAGAMKKLSGQGNILFQEIEGADFYFSDAASEKLADRIAEFLTRENTAVETAAAPPGAPRAPATQP
jgi:pimeloyl-ACP methyl ester carboxylesterase